MKTGVFQKIKTKIVNLIETPIEDDISKDYTWKEWLAYIILQSTGVILTAYFLTKGL